MAEEELRSVLKSTNFGEALDEFTISRLEEKFKRITFEKDSYLIRKGRAPGAFFLLAEGKVSVFDEDEKGAQKFLTEMGPGQYFGEIGLITGLGRTATVKAEEPCVAYMLGKEDFFKILMSSPSVEKILRQTVEERILKSGGEPQEKEKKEEGGFFYRLKKSIFGK